MIFKELIENIKHHLVSEESIKYAFGEMPVKVAMKQRNFIVNDIIAMIEKYEPPILDKPDSEGWWWYWNKTEWLCLYVYDKMYYLDGHGFTHDCELGTWQKAIFSMEDK